MQHSEVATSSAANLRVHPWGDQPGALPLVVEPSGDTSVDALAGFLNEHRAEMRERLREHGAILMRGFRVHDAAAFERVARSVDNELKNEYLGTSPRDGLTDYVFSASELPSFYPIPQHCEMSFTKHPPRHVFFCCLLPSRTGGETPLVDFRKVYADLRPDVRERFEQGGLRIVRNYSGPEQQRRFDPWKLKRWDEMFLTTDKSAIEEKCREEGFEPSWGEGGRLRLVSYQEATQKHPETGVPAWFSHVQVFHVSSAPAEYRRIWRLRRDARSFALWQLTRALVAARRRLVPSDDEAMHATYRDGREIPDTDLEHLRDVIWRHMVAIPWQHGDVVAIDNRAVSHGRLPYTGPRRVAVCWA